MPEYLSDVPDEVTLAVATELGLDPQRLAAVITEGGGGPADNLAVEALRATYRATMEHRPDRNQADRDARALRAVANLVNDMDAATTVVRVDDINAALRLRFRPDRKPAGPKSGTDTDGSTTR